MKTLVEQLGNYAAYHRDRRNIRTHFIGIPMIVLAAAILLARAGIDVGGLTVTPALAVAVVASLYYLKLDLRYGIAMAAMLAVCVAVARPVAAGDRASWLIWGGGLFAAGWVLQFIGHLYEGRKPAFVDDVMGLAIGPLFVLAEAGFLLGLRRDLQRKIAGDGVTAA